MNEGKTGCEAGADAAPSVLLVTPWDQEFGGVASVVGNLASLLERGGRKVVLLHPGELDQPRQRKTARGFVGYEMNLRSSYVVGHPLRSRAAFAFYLPAVMFRLGRILREHRIGVVNIHYTLPAFVYFGLLRAFAGFRLVVSVHGADLFPQGARLASYPWEIRLLMRWADAIVAPSAAFLRDVLSVFPEVTARAHTIHNGIDPEELLPCIGDAAAVSEKYVLCIATHNEKKAVDVLLRAFQSVRKSHSDLHLILIGDGPLRSRLEALAAGLSLGNAVRFLGWQGRSEVRVLLHQCRLFVLPSRSEPFGIAVIEALACAKAVVASRVGGISEIIEHGQSGWLVPPDDSEALAAAMERLLEDTALAARLGEEGRTRVLERFTCARNASEYEALFSTLCAKRSK
jgi:glycosyltransferase involved in cell wall biosynthesis